MPIEDQDFIEPQIFILSDDDESDYDWGDDKPIKKKKKRKKRKALKVISAEDLAKAEEKRKAKEAEAKRKEMQLAEKRAERQRAEYEKRKKQAEADLIQLVARRDVLNSKLVNLNPGKQKDAIKIAKINIELNDVEEAIDEINAKYGLNIRSINQGSKGARFVQKAKYTFRSMGKSIKRFFKRNSDTILKVASIVVPLVGAALFGLIAVI